MPCPAEDRAKAIIAYSRGSLQGRSGPYILWILGSEDSWRIQHQIPHATGILTFTHPFTIVELGWSSPTCPISRWETCCPGV